MFVEAVKHWERYFQSKILIVKNGVDIEESIAGNSLLQIFWVATDLIRRQIPPEAERDWKNERGVDSWILLPKTIPMSWGYDLYSRASKLVDAEEAKFVEQIYQRRKAHEGYEARKAEVLALTQQLRRPTNSG